MGEISRSKRWAFLIRPLGVVIYDIGGHPAPRGRGGSAPWVVGWLEF